MGAIADVRAYRHHSSVRHERFTLEDWFARYKAACPLNITSSDVEPLTLRQVLDDMDGELAGAWSALSLGYGASRGSDLLRAEIASTHVDLEPDQVHCFTGATEAYAAVAAATLGAGDHAVVVTPAYQLLTEVPRALGARVTEVDLRPQEGWRFDLDRVAAALNEATRLVVVNTPNNPTGSALSRAELGALVDLTARAGARLLLDEVYRGLEVEPVPAGADLADHVISLSSVSKVYAAAGLRVGWVAVRDADLLDRLRTGRYYTSLSGSVTSDLLAAAVLRAREQLLRRSRALVQAGATVLRDFAAQHPEDVDLVAPRGGTTAYPRLRRRSAEQVAVELAEQHGVFVAPSSVLLTPGEHLRVGLGRADLPAGLERLGDVLTRRAR